MRGLPFVVGTEAAFNDLLWTAPFHFRCCHLFDFVVSRNRVFPEMPMLDQVLRPCFHQPDAHNVVIEKLDATSWAAHRQWV